MALHVTWEYIDALTDADDDAGSLSSAVELLQVAQDPDTTYDEETSAAAVFIAAAECLSDAEDFDGALNATLLAQDAEGDVAPGKRLYLVASLLDAGNDADARALTETIWEEKPFDPMVYSFMGETYSRIDLKESLRWFDAGIAQLGGYIDDAANFSTDAVAIMLEDREFLVLGRHLVRSNAELAPDELDEEAIELLEEYDLENDADDESDTPKQ